MFDFGFSELLLIGVIALVVLGPERLPKAARMAGGLVGKVQRMVSSVKQELSAQVNIEELRHAKNEFELAANQMRDDFTKLGDQTQSEFKDISESLNVPAWERLPEQKTPADFGVDEQGNSLPEYEPWQPEIGAHAGLRATSLRNQALRRKRDVRPRHRPKPHLRVRKK